LHQASSLRDSFVHTIKDPIGTLFTSRDIKEVLKKINIKIFKGERVAFMGLNGTGKTSLCRMIAGIYHPTTGKVYVKGQTRAFFDTNMGIFPELTGRENAWILAQLIFPEIEDHTELIQSALDFSELGPALDLPFRTYSNGMQTRLCLSVISSRPSEILILDEVFEGADAPFRKKISARILGAIQDSDAVIFVSHHEEQIETICNRAIVIGKGSVLFDGKPDQAAAFYRNSHLERN
jgi:ABC-type polysaccharide/polyol phosphate transport system ATPase subunit